jgi:hypothetical protein
LHRTGQVTSGAHSSSHSSSRNYRRSRSPASAAIRATPARIPTRSAPLVEAVDFCCARRATPSPQRASAATASPAAPRRRATSRTRPASTSYEPAPMPCSTVSTLLRSPSWPGGVCPVRCSHGRL